MIKENWVMIKWCKTMTDDDKDWYVNKDIEKKHMIYRFRLLDDDGNIYGYGVSDKITFSPLDHYASLYGVTEIQYRSPSGKYETL